MWYPLLFFSLFAVFGSSSVFGASPRPPVSLFPVKFQGTVKTSSSGDLTIAVTFPENALFYMVVDVLGVTAIGECTMDPQLGYFDVTWTQPVSILSGTTLGLFTLSFNGTFTGVLGLSGTPRPSSIAVSSTSIVFILNPVVTTSCPKITGTPQMSSLPLNTWRAVFPGGTTTCGDGSDFAYLVRRGLHDTAKVVIDFMGGGFCDDYFSCKGNSLLGLSSSLINAYDCSTTQALPGVGNPFDATNPLANHTYIFVPYCTQDLHAGSSVSTYTVGSPATDSISVRHNGFQNTLSVLKFVLTQFSTAQEVIMTGCSAGGYAAVIHAPHVASFYKNYHPSTKVAVITDSALGIIADKASEGNLRNLHLECAAPSYLKSFAYYFEDKFKIFSSADNGNGLAPYFEYLSFAFPNIILGTYAAIFDSNQISNALKTGMYYSGNVTADAFEWSNRARAVIKRLNALPNFRSFVINGTSHCVGAFSDVWSDNSFKKWFNTLLAGNFTNAKSYSCPTCGAKSIAGCDGVLGSGKTRTMCGACGAYRDDCLVTPISVPSVECPIMPPFVILGATPDFCGNGYNCSCKNEIPGCIKCRTYSGAASVCTQCAAGKFLFKNQCISKCSSSSSVRYYMAQGAGACRSSKEGPLYCDNGAQLNTPWVPCRCAGNCRSCLFNYKNKQTCTTCISGRYNYMGKCVKTCPAGGVAVGGANQLQGRYCAGTSVTCTKGKAVGSGETCKCSLNTCKTCTFDLNGETCNQ